MSGHEESDNGGGKQESSSQGFFVDPIVHISDIEPGLKHYPWYTINKNPLNRYAKFWIFPSLALLLILMGTVVWAAWGNNDAGMTASQKNHLAETVGNVTGVSSVTLFDDGDECLLLDRGPEQDDCFDDAYSLELTFFGDFDEVKLKSLLGWVDKAQLDVDLRFTVLIDSGVTDPKLSMVGVDEMQGLLKSVNSKAMVKDTGEVVVLKK